MADIIKVGFCVAYDWYYLVNAIPLIYKDADSIHLFVDKNRIGWSGVKFEFDEEKFYDTIQSLDSNSKILIHQESFFVDTNSPTQNEVYQRNRMAEIMGDGGWHIQLDCDEYFVHFHEFVKYLNNLGAINRVKTNICCPMITLYKRVDKGYLYVKNHPSHHEFFPIATTQPLYSYGRTNGYFNICTNFCIIHQSWAREEHEIVAKVKTWGHANDFDSQSYLDFWKSINLSSYASARNFHPLKPNVWESLRFIEASSIQSFLAIFDSELVKPSNSYLAFRNSRFMAKVKKLYNLIVK
jgi:hypothetical protein